MVTLYTAFLLHFHWTVKREPCCGLFFLLLWQTDGGRGNKYLFLTVFIHRILAFLKDAINIHRWPLGLLQTAGDSFYSH